MARDLDVGYLGVVVDDRDPQVIFDNMVAAVQDSLEGWTPHNGALDVMLLEAFALGAADMIYAANRSVGALVESVLASYGVPRDEGEPSVGQLTLTFDGTVSTTITAGTAFVTDDGVTLLAAHDTTLAAVSTAPLDVEEAIPGEGVRLAAGAILSPVVGIPALADCTLAAPLTGGRPAEDDAAYLARVAMRQRRVTSSLVTASDFVAYCLEDPRIGRAAAIDRWDAATDSEEDGHITVVVYGRGAALDAAVLTELQATISDSAVSVLTVHVIAAERPTVNMTAGITVAAGYDEDDVADACEVALSEWLSWQNAGFGQTVTPSAIEAILGNVPGVSSAAVTTPSGNVTHDDWEIPAPGTVTINV